MLWLPDICNTEEGAEVVFYTWWEEEMQLSAAATQTNPPNSLDVTKRTQWNAVILFAGMVARQQYSLTPQRAENNLQASRKVCECRENVWMGRENLREDREYLKQSRSFECKNYKFWEQRDEICFQIENMSSGLMAVKFTQTEQPTTELRESDGVKAAPAAHSRWSAASVAIKPSNSTEKVWRVTKCHHGQLLVSPGSAHCVRGLFSQGLLVKECNDECSHKAVIHQVPVNTQWQEGVCLCVWACGIMRLWAFFVVTLKQIIFLNLWAVELQLVC